jgi:Flp pilus assembly pilin Flp
MKEIKGFFIGSHSEDGMGVVEVLLIIVVLIAMVIIFKKQITTLVNNIWNSINKDAKSVYK